MSCVFVVNQLPLVDRYTADWFWTLNDVPYFTVLGGNRYEVVDKSKPWNYFTNLEASVEYEAHQINSLFTMREGSLKRLLITDLDFPGLIGGVLPALKLKFPEVKIAAVLHAGSWCNKDIFFDNTGKKMLELGSILCCDIVFVASNYHKKKIQDYFGRYFQNIFVLGGLPFYKNDYADYKAVNNKSGIVSVGRPEQSINIGIKMLHSLPHADYLEELSKYQIAVFTKEEETFGYSVFEAIACGVIPVAENAFCYPEYLPAELLFTRGNEISVINNVLANLATWEQWLQNYDLERFEDTIFLIYDKIMEL